MNVAQSTLTHLFSRNRNCSAAYFRPCCLVVTLFCGGLLAPASAQAAGNRWVGDDGLNQWNFAASNWTNGLYLDGDNVLFNDSGSANPPVDITTLVAPASVLVNATKTYTFGGAGGISGATGLSKSNTGELQLANSNSYSGATTVSGGRLTVQHNNALGTTAGGTTVTNTGSLQIDGNGLNVAEPLTLAVPAIDQGFGPVNSGLNNLANSNTWSGPVTLAGASDVIRSSAGLLTLNSPTAISGPGQLYMAGDGDLFISSGIASSVGALRKYGNGTLWLTGANASAGGITAYAGSTVIAAPASLGSGILDVSGTIEIAAGGSASIVNQMIIYGGKLRVSGGTVNYSRVNYPQLGNFAQIETAASSDQLVINSPILRFTSEATSLYINYSGSGTVTINSGHATGVNSIYGRCYLVGGTLQLNHLNALGHPSGYNYIDLSGGTLRTGVDAGGAFSTYGISVSGDASIQPGRSAAGAGVSNYFGDLSFFAGQLTVAPGANLNAGSTADLGFGAAEMRGDDVVLKVQNNGGVNARLTLTGAVNDDFALGPRSLTKSGSGTLVLAAANTYRGGTTVSNGTLRVSNTSGSATGTSNVTVLDGATLMGNGRISASVSIQSGGTLSPGASIGALAISNSLVFASGSTNFMEVNLSTHTNDMVVGLTNVTYGGTLVVSNIGVQVFINGAAFKLFKSLTYSGAFAGIQPPTPGAGLAWDVSTLTSDGTLRVVMTNYPPIVANPIPDTNGVYGSAFSFTFAANTFTDPDAGQVLSYVAGGLPPGIAFNGPTRNFAGTPTNTGTFTVTVTATDNGSPLLSTNDTFDIVIALAPLTATANNQSRAYGDTNPPLTFSYSSFVLSETAAVIDLPPTASSSAETNSPVGNYAITLSGGADDHYSLMLSNGTLNITPATLTVTINNTNRLCGETNPVFTGTLNGIRNGDNLTVEFSCAVTETNGAGAYPILPVFTDPDTRLGNYAVVTNGGTLTILPAEISITPMSLPGGMVGQAYAVSLTATGGLSPHTFAVVSGVLPGGLTLTNTGTLGGTPTADGVFPFELAATDANGCSGTNSYSLTILPLPQLVIVPGAREVVLLWSTNYPTFQLVCATNLPATNWQTASPPPVIVNGNYAVTNAADALEKYYRLQNP